MRTLAIIAACACLGAAPASAADGVPDFLSAGQTYANDEKTCKDSEDGEFEGLKLSQAGIFGYEFGCIFVAWHPVKYEGATTFDNYIAITQCGDDSGINRPDAVSITNNSGELTVTSQNDYATAGARQTEEGTDPYEAGMINETFKLCK